uniref:hypothetical protein n=1 Tax=Leucobacter sp. BZR 635 TaxID=3378705 RepID=UPI003A87D1EF
NGQTPHAEQSREPAPELGGSDGLLDKLGLIESQPLDQRARGFEQLHDELLQELQRSDQDGV